MTRILWIASLLFFVTLNVKAEDQRDPKESVVYPKGQASSSKSQINESATAPGKPTQKELEQLQQPGRKADYRKNVLMVTLAIGLPSHCVFSLLHLVSWGLLAAPPLMSHDDPDDEQIGSVKELSKDVFRFGVIGAPIFSGAALIVASAIAVKVVSRSFFSKGNFFAIFGFGLLGLGMSTGLTWAMAATDSVDAFVAVTTLSHALLPPIGEMLGYILFRKKVKKTRLSSPGQMHRPHHVKPQLLPPFPLVIAGMGRDRPVPGLTLGTLVF